MQENLTIQDIARLAGVSKATVSRVLNRNPAVSTQTSERVMRIVQEYDFVPNATATGLAGGKTRLVGVLAPPLVWAGISEMLLGVAGYIEHTPYEIVLYSISFSRNHSDILDRILSLRMVSGLLAILPGALSHHITERFREGLPLVMIDDQEKPVDVPWVGIDNVAGASTATQHLLDLGHRRIAYIQGPQNYICAVERYQGYLQTLHQAGIAPDPMLIFQGRFDTASGRECASALFSLDRAAWPGAIFAANDQMAYGVLEVAEERGIRIPEDISLIGFDDNPLSSHLRPALTTIQQPFSAMGYKAIEQLLLMVDPNHRLMNEHKDADSMLAVERFSHIHMDAAQRIQLPTSLIVRSSTAAPQGVDARSSPIP